MTVNVGDLRFIKNNDGADTPLPYIITEIDEGDVFIISEEDQRTHHWSMMMCRHDPVAISRPCA